MTSRMTALLTPVLAVLLAGCSVTAGGGHDPVPSTFAGKPVTLQFDGGAATATLADTPEARQLAAMLPATLDFKDVWGQAKSGRLPNALTVDGAVPVHDPVVGDIYFWPQTEVIAVYYDDLGQSVPAPGLIRLGAIDAGLDDLAAAGRRVTIRWDLADAG
ncbi:cyclophilin-like fold protein [Actinoplanes sp. NBC_00393]|uniref:cyclophilin-like fold protein n=1 Tax=Actinoplanes sp. NBC_00393 TaxID=2975953 RepID=UPI002E1EDE05